MFAQHDRITAMTSHVNEETIADDTQLHALQQGIMTWWEKKSFDFPWRDNTQDEWRKLVVEILLQRAHVAAVKELYPQFFLSFPDLHSLATASIEEVEEVIYPLGLKWRARFLPRLAEAIHTGGIPQQIDDLLALPGVGPYVAGAFTTLHRNKASTFVDANVVRLLGRYFDFSWDGETRRRKWFLALAERFFTHPFEPSDFGYAVLDFSREVCGRSPNCNVCPVQSNCAMGKPTVSRMP